MGLGHPHGPFDGLAGRVRLFVPGLSGECAQPCCAARVYYVGRVAALGGGRNTYPRALPLNWGLFGMHIPGTPNPGGLFLSYGWSGRRRKQKQGPKNRPPVGDGRCQPNSDGPPRASPPGESQMPPEKPRPLPPPSTGGPHPSPGPPKKLAASCVRWLVSGSVRNLLNSFTVYAM